MPWVAGAHNMRLQRSASPTWHVEHRRAYHLGPWLWEGAGVGVGDGGGGAGDAAADGCGVDGDDDGGGGSGDDGDDGGGGGDEDDDYGGGGGGDEDNDNGGGVTRMMKMRMRMICFILVWMGTTGLTGPRCVRRDATCVAH